MLPTGTILQNRYRIVSLLGEGGMGAVYRAWDIRLKTAIAVKEMIPDPTADPQTLAGVRTQFQREAQILASLSHPNLTRVTDHFFQAGNQYLVMDLAEGENLQDVLDQSGGQPLDEDQVLGWARQLLDALEYCHANNVIHRDIKPANVRLTPEGRALLVDFGLVKLFDPTKPQTATIMRGIGTPEYAPLEQYAVGKGHTDARSDLYSLGATLYHLLTGQAPPMATQRVVSPDSLVAPRSLNPRLSQDTEIAILRAMRLRPHQRFQNAAEMRQALFPIHPRASVLSRIEPLVKKLPTKQTLYFLWRIIAGVGLVILVTLVIRLRLASHIVLWLQTASATVGSWLRSLSGSQIAAFARDNWLGITIVVALTVVILNRRRLLGVVQPILDWLVRVLAGLRARRPKLEVVEPQSGQLFFRLKADLERPEQLRIRNVGGGVLWCRRIETSAPWLKVEPASFRRNEQVVEVWVTKSAIQSGQGHLELFSNGGRALISVSFEVEEAIEPPPPPPLPVFIGREQELQNLTERLVQDRCGHYLLYGYGRFGATTFIRHLRKRVETRLKKLEDCDVLMMIQLDLRWHEPSEVIQVMVDEFCCEVIKGDFGTRRVRHLMQQLAKELAAAPRL